MKPVARTGRAVSGGGLPTIHWPATGQRVPPVRLSVRVPPVTPALRSERGGLAMRTLRPIVPLLFMALVTGGCATSRSLYYDAWEKLGYNKRERPADDARAARDEQANAKKQ